MFKAATESRSKPCRPGEREVTRPHLDVEVLTMTAKFQEKIAQQNLCSPDWWHGKIVQLSLDYAEDTCGLISCSPGKSVIYQGHTDGKR